VVEFGRSYRGNNAGRRERVPIGPLKGRIVEKAPARLSPSTTFAVHARGKARVEKTRAEQLGHNAVILAEFDGTVQFDAIWCYSVIGRTGRSSAKVIIESARTRTVYHHPPGKRATLKAKKAYSIPVGSLVNVGTTRKSRLLVTSSPRFLARWVSCDITGGLPLRARLSAGTRRTYVVSEIDGA
jgi:hypothetical protein